MTHLRQRMIEDMGIRNLADNTQSAYLQQITAYAEHFRVRQKTPTRFNVCRSLKIIATFDESMALLSQEC